MANKCNLDECAVIERYEECETARIVAQEFNVSTETIYRILKRHGVQRTHRHVKETKRVFISNCRSKYCPFLIVLLRTECNMRPTDIAKILDCSLSIVTNVISRKGLVQKRVYAADVDIEQIEIEYLAGAGTYELGKKYGVDHTTISRWMRKRGHHRGKRKGPAIERGRQKQRDDANKKLQAEISSLNGITGKYARYVRRKARKTLRKHDSGISWKSLAKRNGSMKCEICGVECNPNDKQWGSHGPTHPSVDHIIRLVDGGTDTWGNVRLVCVSCNVKLNAIKQNEVITHAEEQTVANEQS